MSLDAFVFLARPPLTNLQIWRHWMLSSSDNRLMGRWSCQWARSSCQDGFGSQNEDRFFQKMTWSGAIVGWQIYFDIVAQWTEGNSVHFWLFWWRLSVFCWNTKWTFSSVQLFRTKSSSNFIATKANKASRFRAHHLLSCEMSLFRNGALLARKELFTP